MFKFLILAFITIPALLVSSQSKLNTRDVKRHNYLVEKVKKEKHFDLLLLGDSITHLLDAPEHLHKNWIRQSGKNNAYLKQELPSKKVLVAGISGETTVQLLSRLQNGLAQAQSKFTVIMIGTNDTKTKLTEKDVAANIEEMVKIINVHNPKTKILLYAIFPRGPVPAKDANHIKNEKVNQLLAGFPEKFKNLKFIDINKDFLDQKGHLSKLIMYDFLHPALQGYKTWIKSIKSEIIE